MKKLNFIFLLTALMAGLFFMNGCSDNDEDEDIQVDYGPIWGTNIERTEGNFTFRWQFGDRKSYIVSYDFKFENEICKSASFTIDYKTDEETLEAWRRISAEKKQVCTLTGTCITYPDQYGYVGDTYEFVSKDIWIQYRTFKVVK